MRLRDCMYSSGTDCAGALIENVCVQDHSVADLAKQRRGKVSSCAISS